ncbi:MAG: glycosyltransferase [Pirellulales bacterium]
MSPSPASSVQRRAIVEGKFFRQRGERLRLFGFTYGPFRPQANGDLFPEAKQARQDFAKMSALGANAIRTYHVPPEWLLDAAGEDLNFLVDIPWSKHLCFLDSRTARREAREAVRNAARAGHRFGNMLAYSIGNEIPPDVVRWHGASRIERFLRELMDTSKQADPAGLVTFGNYPPTEYLDLSFLDFVTFNVYLHDRETFRRYCFRLQNLVGDKPLVLGEIGMDTIRNGELGQAEFLSGHLEETRLLGLAGSFVFSWTDEWYTGQHEVREWAFGVTSADRLPKASYFALSETAGRSAAELLPRTPRVSVVVCSYNGGATLEECLRSLGALDYPDFEVILVDDGSTDNTPEIAAKFPAVRTIRQTNRGLSEARNVGLRVATGEIIAYTDSDCYVDQDWLNHLVGQLLAGGATGVGGPNFAPEDGATAACVAACPGQPTHVLESDQVAEHIPGCNMAFRRETLEAINGFDPQFRKAGDDVDVCWRLQQGGHWITFAPAAFVWHHRRQNPRQYLRQQAGYGEAEALLRFKHPDKFNGRGHGKWDGVLYGASLRGLVLDKSIVYRGTFGCGFFQCIYKPGPAYWAMVPGTLEWQAAVAALLPFGFFWWPIWLACGIMFGLSGLVAVAQAAQARLAPQHDGWRSRALMAVMCYLQPLVRSLARYKTRYLGHAAESRPSLGRLNKGRRFRPLQQAAYWSPAGCSGRTELLHEVIGYLKSHRCNATIDTGWSESDLEVFRGPWTAVRARTVQEEHGHGNRLVRVRYQMRLTALTKAAALFAAATTVFLACFSGLAAGVWLGVVAVLFAIGWYRWAWLAGRMDEVVDQLAGKSGWLRESNE